MFRLETDPDTSQDDLPPQIVRRLQVEELWARRRVLADLMNAERLKLYAARRSLAWPARFEALEMAWKDTSARPAASVVPIRTRKSLAPIS